MESILVVFGLVHMYSMWAIANIKRIDDRKDYRSDAACGEV